MEPELLYYLIDLYRDPQTVSEAVVDNLTKQLDFELPSDYLELMQSSRELEGEVGPNGWLLLFPLDNILQVNKDYILLMERIPDYFLIGKDAADTGFAIHKLNKTYHSFGLMSNFKTDPIEFCGNNLTEFLAYLYNQ
jgi:hypothetical protein